jgi:thiamine biosynthesis protein ThiS
MSNQIKTITVALNGEPREVPEGLSVATFLAHLGLPADRVAVELNRQIVRKADWDLSPIFNGAEVEVVHFVGGGRF